MYDNFREIDFNKWHGTSFCNSEKFMKLEKSDQPEYGQIQN